MIRTGITGGFLALLTLTIGLAIQEAHAQAHADLSSRTAVLVAQLDADRFEVRRRAEQELEALVARGDAADILAAEFRRTLASPDVSFEVRARLGGWLKRLPAVETATAPAGPAIPLLLDQSLGESYAARAWAIDRLSQLARQPQTAVALVSQVRERLSDASLASGDYERLLRLYERARGVWLLSDPFQWKLPLTAEVNFNRAIQQLAQPAPASYAGAWRPHSAARRYLLDMLCQDEHVAKIKLLLEDRLSDAALNDASRSRLEELLEWTHPALVAEIWKGRHQIAEQHLLVDVPRQSLNATRPSHFSRIDDRTAYCVSGQNLTPGEYPVGVAIAHPETPQWMCHLVNLPTPRRRMRYAYDSQRDQSVRLAELTERTLRAFTAERTHLSELQILLFQELDAAFVSRAIGDYFLAVDDRRMEPGNYNLGGEHASHHSRICFVLSVLGTRDVAPRLLDALAKQRFLPPQPDAPMDWPWVTALAIADRDPWENVDGWLASLLDRREPLLHTMEAGKEQNREPRDDEATVVPELGASAAALLLDRHLQQPESFGLQQVNVSDLRNVGCPAYRFESATARQAVIRWWENQKKQRTQREKSP